MNQLKIIHQQTILGKELNIYGSAESPIFMAKDIAAWIDHSNPTEMLRTVDDDEKLNSLMFSSGQHRKVSFVTEFGLYEILMQSRKPVAKEFKRQVKHIIKTIRQTGGYVNELSEERFIENYFPGLSDETKKAMLTDLQRSNKELQRQIEEQRPKVQFAEIIEKSDDSILIRDFAKVVSKNGFVIGEKRLFQWLRDGGYIGRKNRPNQRYIDMGLFELIEHPIVRSTGTEIRFTPRITGKGQLYFTDKLTGVS